VCKTGSADRIREQYNLLAAGLLTGDAVYRGKAVSARDVLRRRDEIKVTQVNPRESKRSDQASRVKACSSETVRNHWSRPHALSSVETRDWLKLLGRYLSEERPQDLCLDFGP